MTQPPPALAPMPQFTAQHWDKVPREKTKVKLIRMTNLPLQENDIEFVEFAFDNDQAFKRRKSELNPDTSLHVNMTVYVETIGGEIVTGMWVPEQGWVFRMTSQDLADYAQRLSTAMHRQREQALGQLTEFIAATIRDGLAEQGVYMQVQDADPNWLLVDGEFDAHILARKLIVALRDAEPRSDANA